MRCRRRRRGSPSGRLNETGAYPRDAAKDCALPVRCGRRRPRFETLRLAGEPGPKMPRRIGRLTPIHREGFPSLFLAALDNPPLLDLFSRAGNGLSMIIKSQKAETDSSNLYMNRMISELSWQDPDEETQTNNNNNLWKQKIP